MRGSMYSTTTAPTAPARTEPPFTEAMHVALKVGANPTVDGQLDDPCWRSAERQTFKRARAKDPEPVAGMGRIRGRRTG